jgi:transposase
MPHDLPQWKAAYGYLRLWRSDGTWDRINTVVRIEAQTPPHNHPYPRKGPRHDGQASQTKQA